METDSSPPRRRIVLLATITLAIATGVLGTVAFEEWLRHDSGYLLHGTVAVLFVGVILLQARNLSRRD